MIDLSRFIDPEVLRTILIHLIIGMSLVLCLLFSVMILQKTYVEHRERLLKRLQTSYLDRLRSSVDIPRPRTAIELAALSAALAILLDQGGAAERRVLGDLACRLSLHTFYARRSRSWSWRQRLAAMEGVALLGLQLARSAVIDRITRERNQRVLAKAIHAFSVMVRDEADLYAVGTSLLRLQPPSSKFNEFVYANCIAALRRHGAERAFETVLRHAGTGDAFAMALKRDMIEAAGKEQLHCVHDVIARYYRGAVDPLTRLTCMRALGGLNVLAPYLDEAFPDPDWRIRAMAARYGWQGGTSAIPLMKRSLRDSNYRVRLNAAFAMVKLGDEGRRALLEEIDGTDGFAREIASYAMSSETHHV